MQFNRRRKIFLKNPQMRLEQLDIHIGKKCILIDPHFEECPFSGLLGGGHACRLKGLMRLVPKVPPYLFPAPPQSGASGGKQTALMLPRSRASGEVALVLRVPCLASPAERWPPQTTGTEGWIRRLWGGPCGPRICETLS